MYYNLEAVEYKDMEIVLVLSLVLITVVNQLFSFRLSLHSLSFRYLCIDK